MLQKFIGVFLVAVLLGIMAGNYVAAKGIYITLTPPEYMQWLVYIAPLLMAVAVVALCVYIAKSKNGSADDKIPRFIAIYVFVVTGIMVSGFCGMYTMKHFVYVAAGVITGLMVILALAFMQGYNHKNTLKIHNTKISRSTGQFMAFSIYAVVVVLSAFMPIGPLPVVFTGLVWALAVAKTKN